MGVGEAVEVMLGLPVVARPSMSSSCLPFGEKKKEKKEQEKETLQLLSGATVDQTFRFWKQSQVPCQALPGKFQNNNLRSFTLPSATKSAPSNCSTVTMF